MKDFIKYHLDNSKILGVFLILWAIITILAHIYRPEDAKILSYSWIGLFLFNIIGDFIGWKKYKKRNE
jgi:hypothetical protein